MNGTEQPKILDAKGAPAEPARPADAPKAAETGPKPVAQLTVTLFEDGNVNLSGPINNKTLCYGMLEVAKDIVRDYVAAANAPRVATPQQPGLFRRLLHPHAQTSHSKRS